MNINLPEPVKNLIKRYLPPSYIVRLSKGSGGVDGRVVTCVDNHAGVAEQYNILRANICALSSESPIKTILTTSSQAREGKTITSCNLAYSLSLDKEKKTLLIDANLRRPAVHSMFGIGLEPGFADLLAGRADAETIASKPAIGNLYILPSGEAISDPTALLTPFNIDPLLNKLKSSFDYIVIDTPPIHEFSDAGIVGSLCDAVFLVVKAKTTQEDVIEESFNRLTEAHARPKGCILTNAQDILTSRQHARNKYKHLYLTPGT